MIINTLLMIIIALLFFVGALDYSFGNRFGIGAKFYEGIQTMGSLALVMIGIVSLAPLLADALIPIITPIYSFIGADPASFANTILAVDMGGYSLAQEMALNEQAGLFSSVFLGTTFGSTLVFTIPVALEIVSKDDYEYFSKGILIGIAAIPFGCIVGGVVGGFDWAIIVYNLIIPIGLSILIIIGLQLFPKQTVVLFRLFGKMISVISIIGLAFIGIQTITGFTILPNLVPLSESILIVGKIAIILAGAFPLVHILTVLLKRPLVKLGRVLSVDTNTTGGMIASLAHNIPMFMMVKDMEPKGKIISIAFAVSASFVLGGHLGFIASINQKMIVPMIVAKLAGGIIAVIIACVTTRNPTEKRGN
nr:ethanolamine utilization protein EutH [Niallia sp. Man26]